ncbi:MAG: 5,10-methylenetetrahydromethanopterin reductase [Pseudonocardiales bacterium]|nr:5,10-methylenetetrahydromethanopterin reductase [Pseudonocardiales bacterium]
MAAALGVVLPPDLPSELFRAYARRADELGLDELWVFEDCFLRGGIAQASVALSIISRIRVGVGILPAGARNVAFASMDISTLAELLEYIEALRSILSGQRLRAPDARLDAPGRRLAGECWPRRGPSTWCSTWPAPTRSPARARSSASSAAKGSARR